MVNLVTPGSRFQVTEVNEAAPQNKVGRFHVVNASADTPTAAKAATLLIPVRKVGRFHVGEPTDDALSVAKAATLLVPVRKVGRFHVGEPTDDAPSVAKAATLLVPVRQAQPHRGLSCLSRSRRLSMQQSAAILWDIMKQE